MSSSGQDDNPFQFNDPPPSKHSSAENMAGSSRVPSNCTYFHPECGSSTKLDGFQYHRLADPFEFVPSTFCAGCSRYPSLGKLSWEGSRETIRDWRKRVRSEAPASLVLFRWFIAPLLVPAVVAGIAYLLSGMPAAIATFLIVWFFGTMYVTSPLSREIWGTYYRDIRRELT